MSAVITIPLVTPCLSDILKIGYYMSSGQPSPEGILYLEPKRFLSYMGVVGAIRTIETMTSRMIITRNMGGGAAIELHDDGRSIMSKLVPPVTVPRSQTVM